LLRSAPNDGPVWRVDEQTERSMKITIFFPSLRFDSEFYGGTVATLRFRAALLPRCDLGRHCCHAAIYGGTVATLRFRTALLPRCDLGRPGPKRSPKWRMLCQIWPIIGFVNLSTLANLAMSG
jgi:hypothetical protein